MLTKQSSYPTRYRLEQLLLLVIPVDFFLLTVLLLCTLLSQAKDHQTELSQRLKKELVPAKIRLALNKVCTSSTS